MKFIVLRQCIIISIALIHASNNSTVKNYKSECNELVCLGEIPSDPLQVSSISNDNDENRCDEKKLECRNKESDLQIRYQYLNKYIKELRKLNKLQYEFLVQRFSNIVVEANRIPVDKRKFSIEKVLKIIKHPMRSFEAEYKTLNSDAKNSLKNNKCQCEEELQCKTHTSLESKCDYLNDSYIRTLKSSMKCHAIIKEMLSNLKSCTIQGRKANKIDPEIKNFCKDICEFFQNKLNENFIYRNQGIIPCYKSLIQPSNPGSVVTFVKITIFKRVIHLYTKIRLF